MSKPLPTHMLGVGNGEAISPEEGRAYLLNLGFVRHEITLAETLHPGSVVTITRLDLLARRSGRRKKSPDYNRMIVALLQNLEELRLQVELYLQRFGSAFVGEKTIVEEDGLTWRHSGLKPNPYRPPSLNASIRVLVLEPRKEWFAKFYRDYKPEIRLPWRLYKPGPTVTANSEVIIVVA